jgi:hypothetical protein
MLYSNCSHLYNCYIYGTQHYSHEKEPSSILLHPFLGFAPPDRPVFIKAFFLIQPLG